MTYVVAEISCAPHGEEMYPVPTTLRICRIFASEDEAMSEFAQDTVFKAGPDYGGQDIYYVLYKLDEPLNLDRCIKQDNTINNCGMWLPSSKRVYGDVSDLQVEVVPPERLRARAREKANAEKLARHKRQKQHQQQQQQGSRRAQRKNNDDDEEEDKVRISSRRRGGDDGDEYYDDDGDSDNYGPGSLRGAAAIPGARYAAPRAGTCWNKFM